MPLQNGQFGSKNKIAKNMQKTTLQSHNSCSMQKTDGKRANMGEIRGFGQLAKMATRQRL